jgi:hypothetical protein
MSDLHAVVTSEIDRLERVTGPGVGPVFAALRAAVEQHRPCHNRMHGDLYRHCVTCWTAAPCAEMRDIAAALGVEVRL